MHFVRSVGMQRSFPFRQAQGQDDNSTYFSNARNGPLLQQAAGLYRQDVERHLQFGYGLAELGMIS